ncbi:hypothetical protein ACFLWB_02825 [Chloroflexota bacterium]
MSRLIKVLAMTLVLVAMPLVSLTDTVFAADAINIVVSPNVLNIESNSLYGHIHADIGYVADANTTVKVNGIDIQNIGTFADDCGNLVVKFGIGQVKDIVIDDKSDSADFVLTYYHNGDEYIGEDSVPVIRTHKNP